MFLFDAFIGNTDRHLNNIHLESTDSNPIGLKLSPILDHGASLLSKTKLLRISTLNTIALRTDYAKPFKSSHEKQINFLVENWYNNKPPIVFKSMVKHETLESIFNRSEEVFNTLPNHRVLEIKKYLTYRWDKYIEPYMDINVNSKSNLIW